MVGSLTETLKDGKVLKGKFNFVFEMFVVPGIPMCKIISLLFLPPYILAILILYTPQL